MASVDPVYPWIKGTACPACGAVAGRRCADGFGRPMACGHAVRHKAHYDGRRPPVPMLVWHGVELPARLVESFRSSDFGICDDPVASIDEAFRLGREALLRRSDVGEVTLDIAWPLIQRAASG